MHTHTHSFFLLILIKNMEICVCVCVCVDMKKASAIHKKKDINIKNIQEWIRIYGIKVCLYYIRGYNVKQCFCVGVSLLVCVCVCDDINNFKSMKDVWYTFLLRTLNTHTHFLLYSSMKRLEQVPASRFYDACRQCVCVFV